MAPDLKTMHAALTIILDECRKQNVFKQTQVAYGFTMLSQLERAMGLRTSAYLEKLKAQKARENEAIKDIRGAALISDSNDLFDSLLSAAPSKAQPEGSDAEEAS